MSTLLEVARQYYNAGLNVLPANVKEKRPIGSWKKFAEERPTFEEAFNGKSFDALALVCGKTSGGLEIIDFDQSGIKFSEFVGLANEKLIDTSFGMLTIESTQHGGKHLAYLTDSCEKNTKLANNGNGVTIETRGEGGICIVASSPGYSVENGSFTDLVRLSKEDRDVLISCARSLDESKKQPVERQLTPSRYTRLNGDLSVADWLRANLDELRDALTSHGWKFLRTSGKWEYYERPGQSEAGRVGGAINKDDKFFYCFTSNAEPFEVSTAYTPLDTISILNNSSQSETAKEYARRIGVKRPIDCIDVDFIKTPVINNIDEIKTNIDIKKDESISFPKELTDVGGTIGEIADLAKKYAIRQQPAGAFVSALSAMSFLTGRSFSLNYQGSIVTPNLYTLFLAPSGMGKEILRRVCSEIIGFYNNYEETAPEGFASVQALQNQITRTRKLLWLHDEFGRDLNVMAGRFSNVNVTSIITECLKLYSNANNRNYLPKVTASEARGFKQVEPIDRPYLSIFATGNPTEFYESTTEAVTRNGYIARFTIIEGLNYSKKNVLSYEEANNATPFSLTTSLKSMIKQWRTAEDSAADPFILKIDKNAYKLALDYDNTTEKTIKETINDDNGVLEMRARLFEKLWKYALLFTLSETGPNPSVFVDRASVELSIKLVDYESRLFNRNAPKLANSVTSALISEFLDFIKLKNGLIERRELIRRFQRRDKSQRDEALSTMLEAEYIERVTDGKKVYYKLCQES